MDSKKLKIIMYDCIERATENMEYWKREQREDWLLKVNHYESLVYAYKNVLSLIEEENKLN